MSISESAQQLMALSERVPSELVAKLTQDIEQLGHEIHAILGDTASAQELTGQVGAVSGEAQQLAAGVQHLRQMIQDRAAYHQQ